MGGDGEEKPSLPGHLEKDSTGQALLGSVCHVHLLCEQVQLLSPGRTEGLCSA